VPKLDDDDSPISAFDISRSMELNVNNPMVRALYAFLGVHMEQVRKELQSEEKQRRDTETARRLARQADEIAMAINQDFSDFRQRLARARGAGTGAFDAGPASSPAADGDDDLVFGGREPAELLPSKGDPGDGGDVGGGGQGGPVEPTVTEGTDESTRLARTVGTKEGRYRKPRGGFSVQFKDMGPDEDRAAYERETRTIFVNTGHPQLSNASRLGQGVEDLSFKRLAYEVAFCEYAIALAFELAHRDQYLDIFDPIDDVKRTMNRIARRAAALYEA